MAIQFTKPKAKTKPVRRKAVQKAKSNKPIAQHPKPIARVKIEAKAKPVARVRFANTKPKSTALMAVPQQHFENLNTLAEFSEAGHNILRRTVEAVFWFSELLWRAKEKLTKDDFGKLSKDLSVAASSTYQYITIAKSDRLRKLRDEGADLPTTSHVLYLIASMPDDEFRAFVKRFSINRTIETATVRQFRVEWKDRKGGKVPKTTRQARETAIKDAAREATAPIEPGADPAEFAGAPEDAAPKRAKETALATFQELGEGLMSLEPAVLAHAISEAAQATEMLTFATKLTEHVEDIRKTLSDKEFELIEG